MSQNFFTKLQAGKTCSYSDLKQAWDATKSNPKDSNFGFLSSIFGMDNGPSKKNYSGSIFKKIAESDGKDGLSYKDLQNLADKDKLGWFAKIKDITKRDFDKIYDSVGSDLLINVTDNNYTAYTDFTQSGANLKLAPFYVLNGNKVIPDNKAKDICQNNINSAKQGIIDYAKKHPDDTKIQEYARILDEGNIKINITKGYGDVGAECKFDKDGKDSINVYYNMEAYYGDDKVVTALLLHELEHIRNRDDLNSVTEETVAETYAIETASKIHGEDKIYDEDNKTHNENYSKSAKSSGLQDNSPGYNGLPEGLGISIDGKIVNVQKNKDSYVVTSQKENKEIVTTVSLDESGKPTKAQRVTTTPHEDRSFRVTEDISGYDANTRAFTKRDSEIGEIIPLKAKE